MGDRCPASRIRPAQPAPLLIRLHLPRPPREWWRIWPMAEADGGLFISPTGGLGSPAATVRSVRASWLKRSPADSPQGRKSSATGTRDERSESLLPGEAGREDREAPEGRPPTAEPRRQDQSISTYRRDFNLDAGGRCSNLPTFPDSSRPAATCSAASDPEPEDPLDTSPRKTTDRSTAVGPVLRASPRTRCRAGLPGRSPYRPRRRVRRRTGRPEPGRRPG